MFLHAQELALLSNYWGGRRARCAGDIYFLVRLGIKLKHFSLLLAINFFCMYEN